MKFSSEQEAKNHAMMLTASHLHPSDIEKRLNSYREYLADAHDRETKEFWRQEITALGEWASCRKYIEGDYPQSIDKLVLELVELRELPLMHFRWLKTKTNPLNDMCSMPNGSMVLYMR